VNLKKKVF